MFYLFSSYIYSGFGSGGIQRASIFLSDTFLSYFQVSSSRSPISFTQFFNRSRYRSIQYKVYITYVLKLRLKYSLCQYCIENRVIYVIMLYPQQMTVRIYSEIISHSVEMLCLVQFFHSCQVLSTKLARYYQWSVYFSYTHLILFTVPSISVIHIWSYAVFRPFQLYTFDTIQCSVHFSYIHLILFTVLSISVIHIWSYTLFRPFQLYTFWSYTVFRPFQLNTFDLIQCSVHFS